QAEDGIRDFHVTGVQTCALPISVVFLRHEGPFQARREAGASAAAQLGLLDLLNDLLAPHGQQVLGVGPDAALAGPFEAPVLQAVDRKSVVKGSESQSAARGRMVR